MPKLSDMSIAELRATLKENQKVVGKDAVSTRIIQRELERRSAKGSESAEPPKRKVGAPKIGERFGPIQLAEIERLYLQCVPQREIAARFGVHKRTIDYKIEKYIKPRLRKRAEKFRDLEFAKVTLLEQIAWEQFERSKLPTRKEQVEKEAVEAGADPKVVKRILTRITRTGETSWLQVVQWCIDWKSKIQGDYAPQKYRHDIQQTVDIRVAGTSPEQFTRNTLTDLLMAIEAVEKKRQDGSRQDVGVDGQPDARKV